MKNNSEQKIIGIIPARGGSKGVPHKNIRKINGKHLIQYSIDLLKNSKYVNKIVVSTDDKKIAKIAEKCGAEIPFMRPKYLSGDSAKTIDVVKHTLKTLNKKFGYVPDIVILINPTVPFRGKNAVDESIKLLNKSKVDIVVQVKEIKTHPYRAYWLKDHFLKPLKKDFIKYHQRQMFPDCYYPTAGISTFWNSNISKFGHMYGPKIKGIISKDVTNIDIDDKFDFFMAEMISKYWNKYKKK
jgi:CMP-N,N'-diacetyllegionaminic acid synthase